MRKTLITLFMLLAGSLTLAAATQSQDRPQTDEWSNPSSQSQMSPDRITIKGCLQRGTTPDTYVLNNATSNSSWNRWRSSEKDQEQTSAQGESRPSDDDSRAMNRDENSQGDNPRMPSAEARAENSYVLVPESENVDLKSHIGHTVEITGEMTERRSADDESQEQAGSSSQTSNRPEIKVTSIRHISETCQ